MAGKGRKQAETKLKEAKDKLKECELSLKGEKFCCFLFFYSEAKKHTG